ncbi:MAG: TetR/AcrR family transcriptional regulator [Actinomycetia bacterium]|nr:TetR/AcrR family transcriptional regulator [Actinomycetes bacterium]
MTHKMQRPGGRTERTSRAVFDATLRVLQSSGYDRLTIDAIANRSGVHKTTIYRRWGSVDAVLFAVIADRAEEAIPLVVTGDPYADLARMARSIVVNIEDPVGRAVAAAALGRPNEETFVSLVQRFWQSRLSRAATIVSTAQESGIVAAGVDPDAAVRAIASMLWFQVMVLREPVSDEEIEAVVKRALSPGDFSG